MIFNALTDVFRVAITAVALYFLLILILRISGKRTLSSMNAFDFIVTVAIGTTLASTILDKDLALTDGLTALIVLISLQFLISYTSSRSKRFSHLMKSKPRLLFYKGELIQDALKQERIVETEILQSLRSNGYSSLNDIEAVILETNGNISILSKVKVGSNSALEDVSFNQRS